jgi:hypothetical protein
MGGGSRPRAGSYVKPSLHGLARSGRHGYMT